MLAAFWCCVIKTLGAADEGIAALEKTKQLVGGASDADANAFGDGTHGIVDFAEPEFFICAEIDAIVAAIDLQRLSQSPRTAREIQELGGFAMALHDFDSFERLKRAYQNGRGRFGRLTYDVEHEVCAVVEENIDVAGTAIHGFDARCGAAEMMTGGIAWRIPFGLDDPAANAADGKFVHYDFANKEAREFDSVLGKLGAANAANGDFRRFLEGGRFQGSARRGHFQADSAGRIF